MRQEIGSDYDSERIYIAIGASDRTRGTYVIGKTGTGKTTLLTSMILQDIENGMGVCVIDPHRDMIDDVLARLPLNRSPKDYIVLDLLDPEYAFGLNLFECSNPNDPVLVTDVREQAVHVFKKVWGDDHVSWGARLEDLLRNISHTLIENQGYTLTDIPRLLYNADFRKELVNNLRNLAVREFWQYSYNPRSDFEQRQLNDSTLNKVRAFTSDALLSHIVGQVHSTIDFQRIMDESKILLVKLSSRYEENTKLLGSMLVGKLLTAALGRTNRTPFAIYADEFHWFATSDFATLFTQARKYGIATTVAHQVRTQLEPSVAAATLQAGNLIVFEVIGDDALDLAGQFDHTPPPPDVTGQKPILSLATDPWGQLKGSGHTNPQVQKIFLRTEELLRYEQERHERVWTAVKQFSESELGSDLRYYAREFLKITNVMYRTRLSDMIRRYLFARMRQEEPDMSELTDMLLEPHNIVESNNLRWLTDIDREDKSGETLLFFSTLTRLGDYLVREPIMVSSGQYEPIYGNPRTYADVHNEIVSQLSSLGKHRAFVRTGGEQFVIDTDPLPPENSDLPIPSAALPFIFSVPYTRSRVVVDEEIRRRADDAPPVPQKVKKEKKEKKEEQIEPQSPKVRIIGKKLNDDTRY